MRDTETGLDEFPARYYSSTQGRWYSPDWASAQVPAPYAVLSNPQTLNLYDYIGSDPTNHADADGHFLLFSEGAYVAQISGQNARNEQEAKQEGAQNQKKDDPSNLQLVPKTDSGSDHQPYRVIEYQLETKKGDAPNQNWYVTEQQTNTTLAPNGTSTGNNPNAFKDSVGGNGPADSKQTFWISTTKGKEEFQTFVHTGAGDYGEIAIHIQHSGNQPAKPTEGVTTNGYFSWPGATVVHYDWPGPHP